MVAANRDIKTIKKIIVHCSDSDHYEADNLEWIWRIHVLQNKWSDVGYHFFINKLGQVKTARPIDKVGSHCQGHNFDSIGVCLSGKKEFNSRQFQAAHTLIKELMQKHGILKSDVYPHNHFNHDKTCPNFALANIWKFEPKTVS